MGPSVHQISYDLLREALRGDLLVAIDSDGLGSAQGRASAALYTLLNDHPIDRRGRCRCCRRRGAVFGRSRRNCRVYLVARFYLHQPDDVLLWRLAGELDEPDPNHGGDRGERPEHPRSRRAPPDDMRR